MLAVAVKIAILCSPVASDGDTLRDCHGQRWRLARVDAPETRCRPRAWCDRPKALRSKAALERLVTGKTVKCREVDADPRIKGYQSRDFYGRPVVRCTVDGRDLGTQLLAEGHVRPWP